MVVHDTMAALCCSAARADDEFRRRVRPFYVASFNEAVVVYALCFYGTRTTRRWVGTEELCNGAFENRRS